MGEAGARASIQPSKPCASLKKHCRNLARSPLHVGPCRNKTDRGRRSAFPSETSGLAPLILAHRDSALPWLVAESGAYPPDRALPDFPRQCPMPLACHHLPKGTKLELGRGAHLGNNRPAESRRPSWLHLSRVSPALHPRRKDSPTLIQYPKTRFRKERARKLTDR